MLIKECYNVGVKVGIKQSCINKLKDKYNHVNKLRDIITKLEKNGYGYIYCCNNEYYIAVNQGDMYQLPIKLEDIYEL